MSNVSTTKAQTLPWQLPATPETEHAVTTRSDRLVGCRDHHITHTFDSSTRPSAPAEDWCKVEKDASDARASSRRDLTRYHRCTEFNRLEATRHDMAYVGIIMNHWNRIPFLSRLPLRRSVHGLDMSDEHPARSQRFSLLTWRGKYLHAWSLPDEHLHVKHARTDAAHPQSYYSTYFNYLLLLFTLYLSCITPCQVSYHIILHPFIFNRLLFGYSKFPGNGCWSSAWNASSEFFTPNFSHQPGGCPWPSVSAAIPMILSAYAQHLQGYGKL